MTPGNRGPKTIKLSKSLKIIEIRVFLNMKNAHQHFEKGALNESSRSLIWSFWEQAVFLEIAEKVSKVSNLDQFWVHPRWS